MDLISDKGFPFAEICFDKKNKKKNLRYRKLYRITFDRNDYLTDSFDRKVNLTESSFDRETQNGLVVILYFNKKKL
jgi:hypothetical protein